MRKLIILQTVTPDYRAAFFENIVSMLGTNFELYAGSSYFQPTIKSHPSISKNKSKNIFFFNRKLLFQIGIWHLIFKNDLIVLELNPRIISNWIFLFVRRFLRKDTYVWGHAWGRKGISSNTDFLRNLMRKLGNGVIVYTNKQKVELQEKMPKKTIFAAPNSLFLSSKMILNKDTSIRKNIIFVSRLVPAKKTLSLVKAFANGIKSLPSDTNLIIIGEGDEKELIKDFIQRNELTDRVKLLGHISDYNKLKKLYSEAHFSVSYGYVGLSVTQSFGFGVPMLVSKNENHSPEIEAVIPGKNAVLFNTDDELDFINKIIQVFKNKSYWDNQREEIVTICKEKYSVESMANAFIKLID